MRILRMSIYKKSLEVTYKVPTLHMEIHKNGLVQMTSDGASSTPSKTKGLIFMEFFF
ncbi:hypothetical protein AHAS_Ahas09G0068800 [Arachis hypogaea]